MQHLLYIHEHHKPVFFCPYTQFAVQLWTLECQGYDLVWQGGEVRVKEPKLKPRVTIPGVSPRCHTGDEDVSMFKAKPGVKSHRVQNTQQGQQERGTKTGGSKAKERQEQGGRVPCSRATNTVASTGPQGKWERFSSRVCGLHWF